mmetsp:Transcript_8504/g.18528  ORF Transcript_8504/g.18528 Transcript_8504/m.18528 type:complete len:164 (-) Transcript_8504:196-687(-)
MGSIKQNRIHTFEQDPSTCLKLPINVRMLALRTSPLQSEEKKDAIVQTKVSSKGMQQQEELHESRTVMHPPGPALNAAVRSGVQSHCEKFPSSQRSNWTLGGQQRGPQPPSSLTTSISAITFNLKHKHHRLRDPASLPLRAYSKLFLLTCISHARLPNSVPRL